MITNLIPCTDYRYEGQLFVEEDVTVIPNIDDIIQYKGTKYRVIEKLFEYHYELSHMVCDCWVKVHICTNLI